MTWYSKDYLGTYLNASKGKRRDKIIADALYSQTSLVAISEKYNTSLSRVQKLVQQHFFAEVTQYSATLVLRAEGTSRGGGATVPNSGGGERSCPFGTRVPRILSQRDFQTTLEQNYKTYLETNRPDLAACYRTTISSFLPRKVRIRI
jgi:hypothetical protein